MSRESPMTTQAIFPVFEDVRDVAMQCREPCRDNNPEIHQQAADVIRERRSILHRQLARRLDRL